MDEAAVPDAVALQREAVLRGTMVEEGLKEQRMKHRLMWWVQGYLQNLGSKQQLYCFSLTVVHFARTAHHGFEI